MNTGRIQGIFSFYLDSLRVKIFTIKTMMLFISILIVANGETLQTTSVQMIKSPQQEYRESNVTAQSKLINVVFYRLDGDKNIVPTVKVKENIVGSLLPKHYAHTVACRKGLTVGIAERGNRITATHYYPTIGKSTTIYIKVNVLSSGKFTLTQVEEQKGRHEVSSLTSRSNIINRHVPDCAPSVNY